MARRTCRPARECQSQRQRQCQKHCQGQCSPDAELSVLALVLFDDFDEWVKPPIHTTGTLDADCFSFPRFMAVDVVVTGF